MKASWIAFEVTVFVILLSWIGGLLLALGKRSQHRLFNWPATFYVWFACPPGLASTVCAAHLLRQTGIVVTPGVGFGAAGEGYCRIALTEGEERLAEATQRIQETGF
jgi:aspartate/methionine/tyrosine aminotransferase